MSYNLYCLYKTTLWVSLDNEDRNWWIKFWRKQL